ncbi:MAG: hypothetical protein IJ684_00485 [Bacteroidales bacterium]|nr:hypothetical protein [Bacteroidales bacterium]
MAEKNKYNWKYCSLGGVTRVNIASGEDIAHLGELDQKLWTVLSCPTQGLEFDAKTLSMLDTDNDGKIKVQEIVAAAQWLTGVLRNPDLLLKGDDTLPLSELNVDNEEGRKLYNSAKQILSNLGLEKESISVSDTTDRIAIFAQTRYNGDGIITPATPDDEADRQEIEHIMATFGTVTDRSGEEGIDTDRVEQFYTTCADYVAWRDSATEETFPYGDATADAFAAVCAMKDKIADYFMRCNLIAFNADVAGALDMSAEQVSTIGGSNLTERNDEIAAYPLARPTGTARLPLKSGINPAWLAAFTQLKTQVLDKDFADRDDITEAEWNGIVAKFAPYVAWCDAKKGTEVEPLGDDTIRAIAAAPRREALLSLIEKDNALKDEAESIANVDKLLYLYRDFYRLLQNYVIFTDFYSPEADRKATFQAGRLFIDQRCCDLCIRVTDMGKHADMNSQSGMYLIYCSCTSKVKNQTMDIVAVLTDGDVDDLRVGQNAIFYDREGEVWDATVTKLVDNPISVRQAFWSPYKKMGRWISDRIDKMAADKDSKMTGDLTAKMEAKSEQIENKEGAPAAEGSKKQMFDIAKFAGIFAAIGLALGYIGGFLVKCGSFFGKNWYNLPLSIVVIMLLISGPSMFIAWRKLRQRNLGPVLNANGWAINAKVKVNPRFGATLTSVAKYPKLKTDDPFADRTPSWKKWLRWIVCLLIVAFCILFFTNSLERFGMPFHKPQTEQVVVADDATGDAAEAPTE